MKNLLLVACCLLWCFMGKAQPNMVPNCSFEQYTACPNNAGQTANAVGWQQHFASPDFFHVCNPNNWSVPANSFGNEPAAHGDAYIGLCCTETVKRSITPLQIGATYEVSMSVSLSDNCGRATQDLGIHFFDNGLSSSFTTTYPPTVSFSNNGVITNKTGWVRISNTFIADSAYDNIVIGIFAPNTYVVLSGSAPSYSYYYIDSVVVKLYTSIQINTFTDTMLCRGDVINVPFTVLNANNYYQPNNVFTLQLSNAAGSFNNPVNIGTLAGNTSGTITGTIPMGTPAGTGYRIRLKSSNAIDSSFANEKDISIGNIIPAKPIALANTPVCTGNDINLAASTTTPGVTWSWKGPQGFNTVIQNPTIPAVNTNQSGNYIVEASIYGCKSEKDTVTISVVQTPSPIIAAGNSPVCAGSTLNLTASNTTPSSATYSWTGPATFTSNAQNPNINNTTTAMSGDYIATANNGGCTAKDTVTILVVPTPIVSAFANTPICSGNALNLTASITGTSTAAFSWTGPLGFNSTQQNPTITSSTTNMSGTYTVTATQNNCSSTASVPATVNLTPDAPAAGSNSPICNAMPLQLNASSTTPGVTYLWNGPANFTSNLQNPVLNNAGVNNTGTYTVVAVLGNCTSATGSTQVSINPIPYIGAYASPNDTVCEGTVVSFVTVPMNGVINPQFQWFKNNNLIQGANNIVYIGPYTTGDSFYCRTYNQDICGNNITLYSNKIGMVVNNYVTNLAATISSSPAQPMPGQLTSFMATVVSGGYTPKYQWMKNGVDVFGATTANWNAPALAPYDEITCFVTTSDTCAMPKTTTSNKIVVAFPTSLSSLDNDNYIHIYPNPNNGSFKVKAESERVKKIEILNITGQVLYSKDITTPFTEMTIDLGNGFANGVYLLNIDTDKGIRRQKITIQR